MRRQQTSNGPAFNHTAQLATVGDALIKNANGSYFAVDAYNDPTGPLEWRGYSTKLCHGSKHASQIMANIFAGVHQLGVPIISFDQEIGGGQAYPCYAVDHDHPPGYGNWMWQSFKSTLQDIRQTILARGLFWCFHEHDFFSLAHPYPGLTCNFFRPRS